MEILEHRSYTDWLGGIKDKKLIAIIAKRLVRVQFGNFGDSKAIGDGVSELRIDYGPGYRIYYAMRGRKIVILLCAGDKSDQKKDIRKAKELNKEV
ncbi:MAG: type II toxin-antitoxin system RelE/ParE family toxin [Rickettsiales bacterium]|jgi:putative addiction module killer protein|nr:type II toxin-antitoxin system RelE/ParE family toxin [Rickettsiales bacterium]